MSPWKRLAWGVVEALVHLAANEIDAYLRRVSDQSLRYADLDLDLYLRLRRDVLEEGGRHIAEMHTSWDVALIPRPRGREVEGLDYGAFRGGNRPDSQFPDHGHKLAKDNITWG